MVYSVRASSSPATSHESGARGGGNGAGGEGGGGEGGGGVGGGTLVHTTLAPSLGMARYARPAGVSSPMSFVSSDAWPPSWLPLVVLIFVVQGTMVSTMSRSGASSHARSPSPLLAWFCPA